MTTTEIPDLPSRLEMDESIKVITDNAKRIFCWNYDRSRDQLVTLYNKAMSSQWNSVTELDWSTEVDPEELVRMSPQQSVIVGLARAAAEIEGSPLASWGEKEFTQLGIESLKAQLSQFMHGEQGAMMVAAKIVETVPWIDARYYAATQTMDEARHVEVYERYIGKLAIVYPISPWLKATIDKTLQADRWVKIAIGMNMVVEGLALAAFHNMRRATTCPLLRALTDGVLRDESRHVAFGNLYVRETLADMHPDDREDVAQFAFEVVKMMADSMGGVKGDKPPLPDPGFVRMLENVGVDLEDFLASAREAGLSGIRAKLPPGQIHSFKDLMMPALFRVGAITERSRALFDAEGIPVWEDASKLEALENLDTGEIELPRQ